MRWGGGGVAGLGAPGTIARGGGHGGNRPQNRGRDIRGLTGEEGGLSKGRLQRHIKIGGVFRRPRVMSQVDAAFSDVPDVPGKSP